MGFKVASRVRGLSDEAFGEAFGTKEQCRAALVRLRWPGGFVCPCCGHREHCVLAGRGLYQCNRCKKQTSPTAGTIFHATKLPLTLWFAAIHLIMTAKNGISSVELGRRLGVKQPMAWAVKHKIMAVMARREGETALTGRVEMDDAYLGGVRSGGKRGRGAAGKTPFVAAVSTSPEGRPRKLKLAPVKGFRKRESTKGWRGSMMSAVESSPPVLAEGPEPVGFFRLAALPVSVVAPAPLGGPDVGPARCLVEGAGEARGLDEGLDEHGRGIAALGPILGQLPAHEREDMRAQVGDRDPGHAATYTEQSFDGYRVRGRGRLRNSLSDVSAGVSARSPVVRRLQPALRERRHHRHLKSVLPEQAFFLVFKGLSCLTGEKWAIENKRQLSRLSNLTNPVSGGSGR